MNDFYLEKGLDEAASFYDITIINENGHKTTLNCDTWKQAEIVIKTALISSNNVLIEQRY